MPDYDYEDDESAYDDWYENEIPPSIPSTTTNPFSCGDYDTGRPPKTLREQAIMGLMAGIRCKPDWVTKVFDETITTKWREEAKRQHLTEIEIQYAIDECHLGQTGPQGGPDLSRRGGSDA
ncbi:MAG: uncharacterized protein KVP18_003495 [Porospora cf. gigantea A]|uniref:uncharacterized protein n=1 Tax=Porospora cf. gigantea A TaxID=2853593 RepID=UPI00355A62C8|nr:MAG: hypothetical protein KVP18_003495 [Porospora cf. gigantea A]